MQAQARIWKLKPSDSKRIQCDVEGCGKPAQYGRTVNGGAPFFYECEVHAPKSERGYASLLCSALVVVLLTTFLVLPLIHSAVEKVLGAL